MSTGDEFDNLGDNEWTEVRRGVPAEEMDGVPDDAIAHGVWINSDGYNKSIILYRLRSDYWLVKEIRERFFIELEEVEYETAMDRVQELMEDDDF